MSNEQSLQVNVHGEGKVKCDRLSPGVYTLEIGNVCIFIHSADYAAKIEDAALHVWDEMSYEKADKCED